MPVPAGPMPKVMSCASIWRRYCSWLGVRPPGRCGACAARCGARLRRGAMAWGWLQRMLQRLGLDRLRRTSRTALQQRQRRSTPRRVRRRCGSARRGARCVTPSARFDAAQVLVERAAQVGQAAVVGGREGVAADHGAGDSVKGRRSGTSAHCRRCRGAPAILQNRRRDAAPMPPDRRPVSVAARPAVASCVAVPGRAVAGRGRRIGPDGERPLPPRRWCPTAPASRPASAAPLVDLPDDWSRSRPGSSGPVWYRVSFTAPGLRERGDLLALYIEHVCTNLEVYLNGQLVHSGGRMSEPVTQQLQPPAAGEPAGGADRTGAERAGPQGRRPRAGRRWARASAPAALSALEIGPQSVLAARHARAAGAERRRCRRP